MVGLKKKIYDYFFEDDDIEGNSIEKIQEQTDTSKQNISIFKYFLMVIVILIAGVILINLPTTHRYENQVVCSPIIEPHIGNQPPSFTCHVVEKVHETLIPGIDFEKEFQSENIVS